MAILIGLNEAWPDTRIETIWRPAYLYDDWLGDPKSLYGRGFNYAKAIPARRNFVISQKESIEAENQGQYDLIVYGSVSRCTWNFKLWKAPKTKIWLVFGDDNSIGKKAVKDFSEGGIVFVREGVQMR